MKKLGMTDVEHCLMIGDRKFDVLGAAAHGIPALGVLYGFGTKAELTKDVDELARLLAKKSV